MIFEPCNPLDLGQRGLELAQRHVRFNRFVGNDKCSEKGIFQLRILSQDYFEQVGGNGDLVLSDDFVFHHLGQLLSLTPHLHVFFLEVLDVGRLQVLGDPDGPGDHLDVGILLSQISEVRKIDPYISIT